MISTLYVGERILVLAASGSRGSTPLGRAALFGSNLCYGLLDALLNIGRGDVLVSFPDFVEYAHDRRTIKTFIRHGIKGINFC